MALTIEQLKAFVETVEQGSFRGAARVLGKHSSTLGEQVANLEIDLGFELFERSRRGISLTEKGQQMYQYARPILLETGLFQDKADSLLEEQPSKLTIAVDNSLRNKEIIECYKSVVQAFPSISLKILNGDAMQVMSWIRSSRADVGIVPTTINAAQDFTYSRGFAFNLNRVVGPGTKVVNGSLDASTVRSLPQIAYNFMLESGLEKAHVNSHHFIEANNANEILTMVSCDMGWAYVPSFIAKPYIETGMVQAFEIDNAKTEIWFSEIIYLGSAAPNPAMKVFIDKVKAIEDMF